MYSSCKIALLYLFYFEISLNSYLVAKVQDVVILPNDPVVHADLTLQATSHAIKDHYDIAANDHPLAKQMQLLECSEKVLEQLD